jgi:Cdc6-like AAA superfamily ATPase
MSLRVSSPVLIGRASEAAQLWAAFERALAGSPTTVVVAGEAGIGKTRLVTNLLAKLGVHSRLEAAAVARRSVLDQPTSEASAI